MPAVPERISRSDIQTTITSIVAGPGPRTHRRRRAMEYSRDVLKAIAAGTCTDVKFAVKQLFKLWRKLGLLP